MSIGKTSQKRSLRDNLRETFDISTRTLSLFDKQFADYMGRLREIDNFSRKEGFKLKPALKEASTLLNGMDYIGATSKLTQFYAILESILLSFDTLTGELADEGHKLLIDHLDEETKENIRKYFRRPKTTHKAASLQRTASVLDWFAGKFKARQRALKSLEKRVPKLGNLRSMVKAQLASAEALLVIVGRQFDLLSKARAKGDINAYHNTIAEMGKMINPAKAKYDTFFDNTLGPYVTYIEKAIAAQSPDTTEAGKDKPSEEGKDLTGTQPVEPRISDESQTVPAENGSFIPTIMPPPTTKPPVILPSVLGPPGPPASGQFMNPHVFENKPRPPSTTTPQGAPPAAQVAATKPGPGPKVAPKAAPAGKEDKRPAAGGSKGPDGKPLPMRPPGRNAWDQYASTHEEFITKLGDVDDNDLELLANEILAYSESLEDSDPVASLKLLAIAEGLIEN